MRIVLYINNSNSKENTSRSNHFCRLQFFPEMARISSDADLFMEYIYYSITLIPTFEKRINDTCLYNVPILLIQYNFP